MLRNSFTWYSRGAEAGEREESRGDSSDEEVRRRDGILPRRVGDVKLGRAG